MTMTNPSAGPFDFESIQGIRDEFDKLKATDCFVAGALQTGLPESDALKLCVVATSRQNSDLKQALAKALQIVPQRYELPDGRIIRKDAEDRLVPLKKLKRNGYPYQIYVLNGLSVTGQSLDDIDP